MKKRSNSINKFIIIFGLILVLLSVYTFFKHDYVSFMTSYTTPNLTDLDEESIEPTTIRPPSVVDPDKKTIRPRTMRPRTGVDTDKKTTERRAIRPPSVVDPDKKTITPRTMKPRTVDKKTVPLRTIRPHSVNLSRHNWSKKQETLSVNSSEELVASIKNNITYLENRINTGTANEKDLKIAIESLKKIKETLSEQKDSSSLSFYKKAQIAIDKAINNLPLGEAFHNIPIEMVAGDITIIEAGIGNNIKKEIQNELVGSKKVQINKKIHFNPFGVKMFLDVNKEDFEVRLLSDEEQQITSKQPSIWRWEVTPLKAGQHLILVKATVEIEVPELGITTKKTVEVFKAKRKVNVNWQYSTYQFVTQNWKEATGVMFGTGSLAAFISWWLAKKEKREKVSS